jgi:two-component system, sensor histidine kinase and response regulator
MNEPITFLVVDDTPENLVAMEALLRRDGLRILTARTGLEALEILLSNEVALAFLDVQMPDMDGFELAELMRGTDRTKHVPIIFVTAGNRDRQRTFKGYESGAVDFLYKPIEPLVLNGKVDVFFNLFRQQRELSNALRLNEMFVGILGHDLRNPLTAMMAGAQVLELQLSDEKYLATIRRITSAGRRMANMIEQMLDLTRARLGGGVGTLNARTRVDVADLVQQTIDELEVANGEREMTLERRGDCVMSGDADSLLQLFSNLVANAVTHGTPGTPIAVKVTNEGHTVVVSVHNGGAIPPEVLPTIFDPFRTKRAYGTNSKGLGLGLFIAQQIARNHGGDVYVDSSVSSGTLFTVRLPMTAKGTG